MYPTDKRLFVIAAALYEGYSVERLNALTSIDPWFLHRLNVIIEKQRAMEQMSHVDMSREHMLEAKQIGFSDKQIAAFLKSNELAVRIQRCKWGGCCRLFRTCSPDIFMENELVTKLLTLTQQ